jgi:O-antigen/teichoic acid export membrane protein
MIAVRHVPKEQFGVFILFQVIVSFFVMISGVALEKDAVTKIITSVELTQKKTVVNTAVSYGFMIALFLSLLIVACRPLIFRFFESEELLTILYLGPAFLVLTIFDELFLNVLQGFQRFKQIAVSQIMRGSTKLLLVVILMVVYRAGFIGLVFSFLFSMIPSIIYQYFTIPVKKGFSFKSFYYKKIFRFGLPLGLNHILIYVFAKIDRLMIGSMLSTTAVAYYEIADKLPISANRLYQSYKAVFFPITAELFSNDRMQDAEAIINTSLRLLSFITLFAALFVALFRIEIVTLLFSEEYLHSALPLTFLMISLFFEIIGNILAHTLVAYGKPEEPIKFTVIQTVINVAGNAMLIPRIGVMGAVYATIFCRVAINPYIVFLLRKEHVRVHVVNYVKPLILYVFCFSTYMLWQPHRVSMRIAFLFVFLILCYALAIIQKKDLINLVGVVKKG